MSLYIMQITRGNIVIIHTPLPLGACCSITCTRNIIQQSVAVLLIRFKVDVFYSRFVSIRLVYKNNIVNCVFDGFTILR